MNEMKNEKNDNCMSYLYTNECTRIVIQIVTKMAKFAFHKFI